MNRMRIDIWVWFLSSELLFAALLSSNWLIIMQFDKSSSGTKQRKTVAVCSSLHVDDKIELIRSGT